MFLQNLDILSVWSRLPGYMGRPLTVISRIQTCISQLLLKVYQKLTFLDSWSQLPTRMGRLLEAMG